MTDNTKNDILEFLAKTPSQFFNLSEISRAVSKSQPTVTKAILILKEENKITYVDKNSMILVRYKR